MSTNVIGVMFAVVSTFMFIEALPFGSSNGNVIVIKGIPFNIDRHANRDTTTVTTTSTAAPSMNSNSTAALLMSNNSTVYDAQSQNFTDSANATDAENEDNPKEKTMSTATAWYLSFFGFLVCFFFVVTVSEMIMGSPMYPRSPTAQPGFFRRQLGIRNPGANQLLVEAPPPPYDLFAPPSYDTVKTDMQHGVFNEKTGKKLADVFVVPVHSPDACKHQVADTTAAVAEVDAKLMAILSPTPEPKKKSQPPTPKEEPNCKSVDN